ncbi:iron chelate uptake ABC transporter family permease subunit [Microbacterium oxydans]|nr:iron chelate uptake ABC transporter family permease subunit [Microbacterium oxydans]
MSGTGTVASTVGMHVRRPKEAEGAVVGLLRDVRRRTWLRVSAVFAALVVIVFAAFSVELLVGGSAELSPGAVLDALFGEGTVVGRLVVWESRLPRALTAVLVGALFGMAGVVYQRLIGNVLATPDIIGVSSGASAGAVAVLVGLGGTGIAVQGGAVVGAVLAVLVIFGLSWKRESSTYRLVLVGIGVGGVLRRRDELPADVRRHDDVDARDALDDRVAGRHPMVRCRAPGRSPRRRDRRRRPHRPLAGRDPARRSARQRSGYAGRTHSCRRAASRSSAGRDRHERRRSDRVPRAGVRTHRLPAGPSGRAVPRRAGRRRPAPALRHGRAVRAVRESGADRSRDRTHRRPPCSSSCS